MNEMILYTNEILKQNEHGQWFLSELDGSKCREVSLIDVIKFYDDLVKSLVQDEIIDVRI